MSRCGKHAKRFLLSLAAVQALLADRRIARESSLQLARRIVGVAADHASRIRRNPPLHKALEPHFRLLLTARKKLVHSSSTLYVVV